MKKEIVLTALSMVPFSISYANESELIGVVKAETLNAISGTGYNDEILFS